MPSPTVIALAQKLREAINKHDQIALGRIIGAYGGVWARLQDLADALALEIAGTEDISRGQVLRLERYKALIDQTERELRRFSGFMETELRTGAQGAISLGTTHARLLMLAARPQLQGTFNQLPRAAIETLLGFLQNDSPLFKRIELLAPSTAEFVSKKLLEGVAVGLGPRQIAGEIRKAMGLGLTDALRMTRTAQLWSYREATRANYIANGDVVDGWIWLADLSGDPCMSCVAMHGTEHPLTESLDDHYNGRCSELPKLVGEPPTTEQSGEAWFETLDESKQRELMGDARWQAWKDGKFEFAALSTSEDDEVYGSMRVETALEALLAGL